MRSNILVALLFLLFICCIHFCNSVNTFDSERIKQQQLLLLKKHTIQQYIQQHLFGTKVLKKCLSRLILPSKNINSNNNVPSGNYNKRINEYNKKINAKILAKAIAQSLKNVHKKIPKLLNSPILKNVHNKILNKIHEKRSMSLLQIKGRLPVNNEQPQPSDNYLRAHHMLKNNQPKVLNSMKNFRLKRIGGGTKATAGCVPMPPSADGIPPFTKYTDAIICDKIDLLKGSAKSAAEFSKKIAGKLPMVAGALVTPPPSIWGGGEGPLPKILDAANLKNFDNLAGPLKQKLGEHQEMFDQTFGKLFSPESGMMESIKGCSEKVLQIDASPCIRSVANRL